MEHFVKQVFLLRRVFRHPGRVGHDWRVECDLRDLLAIPEAVFSLGPHAARSSDHFSEFLPGRAQLYALLTSYQ